MILIIALAFPATCLRATCPTTALRGSEANELEWKDGRLKYCPISPFSRPSESDYLNSTARKIGPPKD